MGGYLCAKIRYLLRTLELTAQSDCKCTKPVAVCMWCKYNSRWQVVHVAMQEQALPSMGTEAEREISKVVKVGMPPCTCLWSRPAVPHRKLHLPGQKAQQQIFTMSSCLVPLGIEPVLSLTKPQNLSFIPYIFFTKVAYLNASSSYNPRI